MGASGASVAAAVDPGAPIPAFPQRGKEPETTRRNFLMNRLLPRALMAPAVLTLLLWMIVPLAMTLYLSLIHI